MRRNKVETIKFLTRDELKRLLSAIGDKRDRHYIWLPTVTGCAPRKWACCKSLVLTLKSCTS
jgi:integrase